MRWKEQAYFWVNGNIRFPAFLARKKNFNAKVALEEVVWCDRPIALPVGSPVPQTAAFMPPLPGGLGGCRLGWLGGSSGWEAQVGAGSGGREARVGAGWVGKVRSVCSPSSLPWALLLWDLKGMLMRQVPRAHILHIAVCQAGSWGLVLLLILNGQFQRHQTGEWHGEPACPHPLAGTVVNNPISSIPPAL